MGINLPEDLEIEVKSEEDFSSEVIE